MTARKCKLCCRKLHRKNRGTYCHVCRVTMRQIGEAHDLGGDRVEWAQLRHVRELLIPDHARRVMEHRS